MTGGPYDAELDGLLEDDDDFDLDDGDFDRDFDLEDVEPVFDDFVPDDDGFSFGFPGRDY